MKQPQTPLTVGIAQLAPAFFQREQTLEKVVAAIGESARRRCGLLVFPEAFVPGYPFWLCRTDGARFECAEQKEFYARYLEQAVDPAVGHLHVVCEAAAEHRVAVVLGIVERARDRGGHSLYCARVWIGERGEILSVHRKLMPTYEERLVWGTGDGHGLRIHPIGAFRGGALNCWENWMPLARAALYGQGETLHIALWPGRLDNTEGITRFLAREGRSFAISVSGLLREQDLPRDLPRRQHLAAEGTIHNGGSAVAGPDGSWLLAPVVDEENILTATLDPALVARERQNFDPFGHYSRPDVLQLTVRRDRQTGIEFRP